MNCPDCNAHNADSATFCTLCMRSFASPAPSAPQPPPPPPPAPVPASPQAPHGAGEPIVAPSWDALDPGGDAVLDEPAGAPVAEAGDRPPGHGTSTNGRFRRTDEGFDWQCDRCASWSPLELTACHVCARPFRAAMGQEDEQKIDTSVNPALAIGMSAVLPGAGHILLGRPLPGWSRVGLALLWVLGGVSFVGQAAATSTSALAAVPLFLGVGVLAVVSVLDVQFLLHGSKRTALTNRAFLWLVMGVFGATIATMVPGLLRATGDATGDGTSVPGETPVIIEVDPNAPGAPDPSAPSGPPDESPDGSPSQIDATPPADPSSVPPAPQSMRARR